MAVVIITKTYLKNRTGDKVLLEEGLGSHVVHDGGGKVCKDAVHRVPRLLPEDEDDDDADGDDGDDNDLVILRYF